MGRRNGHAWISARDSQDQLVKLTLIMKMQKNEEKRYMCHLKAVKVSYICLVCESIWSKEPPCATFVGPFSSYPLIFIILLSSDFYYIDKNNEIDGITNVIDGDSWYMDESLR